MIKEMVQLVVHVPTDSSLIHLLLYVKTLSLFFSNVLEELFFFCKFHCVFLNYTVQHRHSQRTHSHPL